MPVTNTQPQNLIATLVEMQRQGTSFLLPPTPTHHDSHKKWDPHNHPAPGYIHTIPQKNALQQNVASPFANERNLSFASEVDVRSGGEEVNSPSQQLTTASIHKFTLKKCIYHIRICHTLLLQTI
jgi:hypothetical protein